MFVERQFEKLVGLAERFFKTDIRYLVEGGFWLTAIKGIALATSFVSSIAFANLLPEEIYGVYRYVLSVLPILALPTLAGIDTALTRAVAQGRGRTLFPALALKMRWGILGTLAALGLCGYYLLQGDERLGLSFLIAAAFMPLMEPFNIFVAYLTGKQDFKRLMFYGAVARTLPTLILIAIIFFTSNIHAILIAYFLSYTGVRYLLHRLTLLTATPGGDVDLSALGFGKHISLMNVLGVLSTSLDKVLVFHFLGGAALAGYYLALVPYKQISSGLSSLTTLALPKLSRHESAESIRATLPAKVWKSYLIIVPVILVYWVLAPYAFGFIYPKYLEYAQLSEVFMLQLLFFPLGMFYTSFEARAAKRNMYTYSVSYAVLRVVLVLLLVPSYGIWGGAAALIAANFFGGILSTVLFYRLK